MMLTLQTVLTSKQHQCPECWHLGQLGTIQLLAGVPCLPSSVPKKCMLQICECTKTNLCWENKRDFSLWERWMLVQKTGAAMGRQATSHVAWFCFFVGKFSIIWPCPYNIELGLLRSTSLVTEKYKTSKDQKSSRETVHSINFRSIFTKYNICYVLFQQSAESLQTTKTLQHLTFVKYYRFFFTTESTFIHLNVSVGWWTK